MILGAYFLLFSAFLIRYLLKSLFCFKTVIFLDLPTKILFIETIVLFSYSKYVKQQEIPIYLFSKIKSQVHSSDLKQVKSKIAFFLIIMKNLNLFFLYSIILNILNNLPKCYQSISIIPTEYRFKLDTYTFCAIEIYIFFK